MNNTIQESKVVKRSLSIKGHRTSISLEAEFWTLLKSIASTQNISIAQLVAEIDSTRRQVNLSSALRVFVLNSLLEKSGLSEQS
jgi:predicted DNA-binding ribbon-helix-helix protein